LATASLLLRYVGEVDSPILQLVIIAGFGGLSVGRDRHFEDADRLAVALTVSFSVSFKSGFLEKIDLVHVDHPCAVEGTLQLSDCERSPHSLNALASSPTH
jgi:hypothetical protein